MAELRAWLTAQADKLSRGHDFAKACLYMLRRWDAFTRFLNDGRMCLANNIAERTLRWIPLGHKAWIFCGSDRGGQRAAILYTLIQTTRLNDVDQQLWLADVLVRMDTFEDAAARNHRLSVKQTTDRSIGLDHLNI